VYPVTTRTTPHRVAERVSYDRAAAHAILDEAYVCHLAFTAPDGPRVLPTLVARIGDTLYVHGSTGSGPLLALPPVDLVVRAKRTAYAASFAVLRAELTEAAGRIA